jgi:SAM-dependent methyltransferase
MDPRHGEGEWKRFAQNGPWPVADGSVEAIRASHVMEHIPAGAPRIEVMNEAHRVLSPGGTFEIIVPNCLSGTWHAWADPTHISFWCPESFHYFDGLFAANADYNIRLWQTLSLSITDFQEVAWTATPRNK